MHAHALRHQLLLALGLPAVVMGCPSTTVDDKDTDTNGETDNVDTDATETDDTDVVDTDDTDVVDTDDTDDTHVVDTDDTDAVQVATETCDPDHDAITYYGTNNWLDASKTYRVCVDVPQQSQACADVVAATGVGGYNAQVDAALDAILPPPCIYDTGFNVVNPPCSDGGFDVTVQCGPMDIDTTQCCFEVSLQEWAIGRPFTAEGEIRTAPTRPSTAWSDSIVPLPVPDAVRDAVVAGWTRIAQAEHASVASFAAFVLDLTALGAPSDLVMDATRAMADEVAHARTAFGIASAIGGTSIGPGPLSTQGAAGRTTPADVLVATILEGCVGETIAAHEAAVSRDLCTDPAIAVALRTIAEDEGRHAALAWRTVRWILAEHPELTPLAHATFDRAEADVRARHAEGSANLVPWGLLSGTTRLGVACTALTQIVAPCREGLLG